MSRAIYLHHLQQPIALDTMPSSTGLLLLLLHSTASAFKTIVPITKIRFAPSRPPFSLHTSPSPHRTNRPPSRFPAPVPAPCEEVPPFRNAASASSHARPAPNPRPTQAGHARRLKSRTEKMTPKERPREERMTREERAWSHCVVGEVS